MYQLAFMSLLSLQCVNENPGCYNTATIIRMLIVNCTLVDLHELGTSFCQVYVLITSTLALPLFLLLCSV